MPAPIKKKDEILETARKLGHNIGQLLAASPLEPSRDLADALNKCDLAPIVWRYEAEVKQARADDDRNYYATVGNENWVKAVEDFVASETKEMGDRLASFSRIVTGKELIGQILGE